MMNDPRTEIAARVLCTLISIRGAGHYTHEELISDAVGYTELLLKRLSETEPPNSRLTDMDEFIFYSRAQWFNCAKLYEYTVTLETGKGETYGSVGDMDALPLGGTDHQADIKGAWCGETNYGWLIPPDGIIARLREIYGEK